MCQQAFPLRTFGYVEPSPNALSYPYLPVPLHMPDGTNIDGLALVAGGFAFIRRPTE